MTWLLISFTIVMVAFGDVGISLLRSHLGSKDTSDKLDKKSKIQPDPLEGFLSAEKAREIARKKKAEAIAKARKERRDIWEKHVLPKLNAALDRGENEVNIHNKLVDDLDGSHQIGTAAALYLTSNHFAEVLMERGKGYKWKSKEPPTVYPEIDDDYQLKSFAGSEGNR